MQNGLNTEVIMKNVQPFMQLFFPSTFSLQTLANNWTGKEQREFTAPLLNGPFLPLAFPTSYDFFLVLEKNKENKKIRLFRHFDTKATCTS